MMTQKGLTLSELNRKINDAVKISFPDDLWIVGEISEMRISSSGHCYMEIIEKDSDSDNILAKQRANIWSYTFRMLSPYFESSTGYKLSSGLKILINVQVEFHEIYGLSLNIKDIEPDYTIGDLTRKKREIILRLQREGVIDMNRNLSFPLVPQRIAIISSATAAGLGDFQSSLHNNSYGFRFHTELFQAIMQGEKAEESIIEALERIFEKENEFDAVAIIRGGGATSDMECFNNYNLAYHIAQFPVPVLTGIGHERDETITDIVAHRSLKTPTAVAEFLIDALDSFFELIISFQERLTDSIRSMVSSELQKLSLKSQKINYIVLGILQKNIEFIRSSNQRLYFLVRDYQNQEKEYLKHSIYKLKFHYGYKIKSSYSDIAEYESRLQQKIASLMLDKKEQLAIYEKTIIYLDPVNVLKRGYSITYLQGEIVRNSDLLNAGDKIMTRLYEGLAESLVIKDEKTPKRNIKKKGI
jgi:exodeoxyribonuclease VII large subunit